MAKKRIKSQHAVGASLSPQSMQNYIKDWSVEQGQRSDAFNRLQDVLLRDPFERQKIALKYTQDRMARTGNLAGRGLSAAGYSAHDIHDIERTRMMAESAQALKVRTATSIFNTTIQNLNNARTAIDKATAAEAGQNIKAGTGKYKNEKPAGWRPPTLATSTPAGATYTPAAPAQAPAAPGHPTPTQPTRQPTAHRLTPPGVLGAIHSFRPRGITSGKRVRLA